jgi:DNA-binding PadR family transcriptional regulator
LVFERTSLYRALESLQRDKFVFIMAGKGRMKRVELTQRGAQRVAEAEAHWARAQQAFVNHFGRSAWNTLSAQLWTSSTSGA